MASSLGVYVGTENIDVVALSGSFQNPKLLTFARSRLPDEQDWRNQTRVEGPEVTANPAVNKESGQSVARVIQTILPKLGITAARSFIAVPAESTVIRYFQMPAIPSHERKMAITFEAKKYLPFKLEELITDYEIVLSRSDPSLMRVMFFGIKRSSIGMYLSLFPSAGITPLCLEPAPLSLMRLLRHNQQTDPNQVAAILHIEHDSATISLARDDLLYLSRNVSILPAGETTPAGQEGAPDLLEALVNETRVSIDYYRRRFLGEPPIQKVIVFGQELDSKRIAELSGALDLPVISGNPFSKIAGAATIPPGLAVAAGLALRGLERKTREVNLLPPEQRKQNQGLLKPTLFEMGIALLLLILWYGISMADLNAQRQQVESLQTGQIHLDQIPAGATNEDLRRLRANREKETQFLKTIAEPSVKSSELFIRLSKLLPQESWFQHVVFRESLQINPVSRRRALHLDGSTYTADRDVELQRTNEFLSALRADPLFKAAFSEFSLDSVQRTQFQDEDITEFLITVANHPEELKKGFHSDYSSTGIKRMRP